MLGFLGVSTPRSWTSPSKEPSFNPVLGFLGVSTLHRPLTTDTDDTFQSRAGFSGRLDKPRSLA